MRKNDYTKKFIGFEIPHEAWDGLDWINNIVLHRTESKFYTIEAANYEEAKSKLFDELCKEWGQDSIRVFASERARHILEDDDESKIISEYGEHDGRIIIQISGEFLDLDEKLQEECPFIDKLINQLSEDSILDLAFECKEIDLGIVEINKNL